VWFVGGAAQVVYGYVGAVVDVVEGDCLSSLLEGYFDREVEVEVGM
jgi:hypothetical protein